MRFEIKAGGAIAILVGLGVLSGGVFVLGLVAGYEVGRQQDTTQQQMASVYPLPSAPEAESSPATAPENASGSSAASGLAAASPVASPGAATGASDSGSMKAASAQPPLLAPPPSVPPPAPAVPAVENAANKAPPPAPPVANASSSGSGTAPEASSPPAEEPEHRVASTAPPSIPRRKGYNIQIQAVMDKNGADEMVAKLQRMGYQAYTMHTEIGGQTWYRVRVGPYATEAEAKAAEERLHEEYAHSTP